MARMMTLRGVADIQKKLKKDAELLDVKDLVKVHTVELNQGIQRRAPVRTGYLRRSVMMSMEDFGMTGHVTVLADYAANVNFGTRFQDANPFVTDSYYIQKVKFQQDLKRLF